MGCSPDVNEISVETCANFRLLYVLLTSRAKKVKNYSHAHAVAHNVAQAPAER